MRGCKHEFDYLVVDQITNMHPNNRADFKNQDWRSFSQIALELRRLASYAYKNRGIPVLTAVHAAGGTTDKKELTTDDTALAKAITWHAHASLFTTKVDGEYRIGRSKLRDGFFETFLVHPQWEYWALAEEVFRETYGDSVEEAMKAEAAGTKSLPMPPQTSIDEEITFDVEELEREIEASKNVALALVQSLDVVPAEAFDEIAIPEKIEPPQQAPDELI
jgi:hypothetical protein